MRGTVVAIIARSGLLDTFRVTRIERLAASLARVCRVDVLFTEHRGPAAALAADTDADVVVTCGGDGTASEIAWALFGRQCAIAHSPLRSRALAHLLARQWCARSKFTPVVAGALAAGETAP